MLVAAVARQRMVAAMLTLFLKAFHAPARWLEAATQRGREEFERDLKDGLCIGCRRQPAVSEALCDDCLDARII